MEKNRAEGAEGAGDCGPRTFGLISLSCGFVTNSTIPENAADAGYVPALHEFSAAGRADYGADRQSFGGAAVLQSIAKVAISGPFAGPDCKL